MKLHHIEGYIQSIYLVEYTDKFLLLDGCCRADIPVIQQFIELQLGRKFSELALVVVTHMHPDHAGAAAKLRALTGCRIAVANVNGHWYTGIDGVLMLLTDVALAHWVAKRMGKPKKRLWYQTRFTPDFKLDDGDLLPGFEEWQAHFTQGHTDRDLSLLHIPSQKIYIADLMVKVKGKYIPPFPVFYPNRYLASINKIKDLNVNALWLAHGGEIQLSEDDYQHLFEKSPRQPMTHWRSVKSKFKTVLSNKA
ncbi:MBL fold metallo-hydrolase [Thalassotalea atypica]|uniref:MBL fold metallo-hydrolase n=1 Tax=Thalassotalea atypica TaxID=2054316 RepID=UPI002572FF1D|nr:MBL fold metallo-hydrolase [Thalassotalea atypica]